MLESVPYSYESTIVEKEVDKVWKIIKSFKFEFWSLVKKSEFTSNSTPDQGK